MCSLALLWCIIRTRSPKNEKEPLALLPKILKSENNAKSSFIFPVPVFEIFWEILA